MLQRFLILASVGSLLSACATSTTPLPVTELPPVSASTLQPCPRLQALQSGSHQAVEAWAVESALRYRECAERQAMLAQILRSQNKATAK